MKDRETIIAARLQSRQEALEDMEYEELLGEERLQKSAEQVIEALLDDYESELAAMSDEELGVEL